MRLWEISEGIYMKGNNELWLSQEAMCEFIELHWNNKVTMHDSDKITVEKVKQDARTGKFIVVFRQQGTPPADK